MGWGLPAAIGACYATKKKRIICLGGINSTNLKKIYLTKSVGIGSISWIKKNGQNKNLGRF